MNQVNDDMILELRNMAHRGNSVTMMFNELRHRLGPGAHILTIIEYFRVAFFLSLAEAKPIGALSRPDHRQIEDEKLLEELVMPAIDKHRSEWDT
jgi:hypothetical protein